MFSRFNYNGKLNLTFTEGALTEVSKFTLNSSSGITSTYITR
jgi:hypothetical protein